MNTPSPRLIMTQMLGVSPWFMKPTPNASHILRPRTRPLALRANAISFVSPHVSPLSLGTRSSARAAVPVYPARPKVSVALELAPERHSHHSLKDKKCRS